MKPGSDENIELGDPVPVVELDKIDSIGRLKDIHSSDTLGLTVPAYAPDEDPRAAAEFLKTLQKKTTRNWPPLKLKPVNNPWQSRVF